MMVVLANDNAGCEEVIWNVQKKKKKNSLFPHKENDVTCGGTYSRTRQSVVQYIDV